jgi:hypothetical protein
VVDPYEVFTRTIEVHRRLLEAGIDNAIGGALALGYHVDDPRGTQDIDINVSLPSAQAVEALAALPPSVPWDDATVAQIRRDDQVRIMWPVDGSLPIPLDLFFAVHPLHDVVRSRTVEVPMHGSTVKILSATDLTVFKALFNRAKDWPDIEAMLSAHDSSVDLDEAERWVAEIVGASDPRTQRLRGLRRG